MKGNRLKITNILSLCKIIPDNFETMIANEYNLKKNNLLILNNEIDYVVVVRFVFYSIKPCVNFLPFTLIAL